MDTADQIVKVFRLLGTPSVNDLLHMNNPISLDCTIYNRHEKNISHEFLSCLDNTLLINLLKQIFVFNPSRRPTAKQCLENPFFGN